MIINIKLSIHDRVVALCKKIFTIKMMGFLIAVCLFASGLFLFSEQITKEYDFTPNTTISSDQVNSNFDALYTLINEHDQEIESIIEGGEEFWNNDSNGINYSNNFFIMQVPE